jgi:hypothetical protein
MRELPSFLRFIPSTTRIGRSVFLNADAVKTEIPGIRALQKQRFASAKISDKVSFSSNV